MAKATKPDAGSSNTDGAVSFLEQCHPGGPWHLVGITEGKPNTSHSFTERDPMRRWIDDCQGNWNVYFHVARLHGRPRKGKASKTEVAQTTYLHVDVDNARPETLARLRAWCPKFTAIVMSGGGYHAYYKLSEPCDDFDLVETCNKAMAKAFEGDASAHNIDRIMRVPGTINLPNASKRAKGRSDTLAELVEADWLHSYDIDLLEALFTSEHLATVMSGTQTHDAVLKLIGELVNVTDDDALIEQIINAALPDDYKGNSCKEAPGMIRDARRKLDSGAWQASSNHGVPPFSEEALALEFTEAHGRVLRFVAKWGRWMVWTGTAWQEDDRRTVFTRARTICRDAAQRANKKLRRTLASAKTRAAVVSLAADDARTIAVIDQWDADPWLLNTPGGTIELKTGELREHRADDYLTKLSAVAPDPNQPTPLWTAFLQRVTGDNTELQAYLQRVAGYLMTGVTYEHALFFLHGDGGNGKSVFVSTLTGIVGDYHRPVPMDALMTTRNEKHPTELAGLLSTRVASAIETQQGRNWDEPKVHMLTGGDKITARLMRQDFFDFVPQFKLLIAGNHKPGLRSVNEAIRRRLHLIPFTVTISTEERDKQLADKLKEEWSGILVWMIEGCRQWQREGLAPPAVVTDATQGYLEAQDMLSEFLDWHCICEPKGRAVSSKLYSRWKTWMEERGEKPGRQRAFLDALEQKGFKRERTEKQRIVHGLTLRYQRGDEPHEPEEPPEDAPDEPSPPF